MNTPEMHEQMINDGYESLRLNNYSSRLIINALSMAAGLDYAIASIKDGLIDEGCRDELRQLIAQTLNVFCYPIAYRVLCDEGLINKEVTSYDDLLYRFDLPDDTHDDLVIYYKDKPILDS